ncbi:MAG TPA: GDSL-type esterase/lipase family protein [Candidatus Didemnitutus sp.]|nr:GDSL-type esterase/lipase family protein [Candidatus Didemnitutus sp.]
MNRLLPWLLGLVLLAGCTTAPTPTKTASHEVPATDAGLPGVGPIRRYDWFTKLWKEKRDLWASRVDQDQGAVVFLGDSITQGWNDDFRHRFDGMKLANRGISGDTTRGVLIRVREDVVALHPKAVVLLIGTNDLDEHATPEMCAQNMKLIITELHRGLPRTPIILCQVFPSSPTKNRPPAAIKKMNSLYLEAVKGDRNVIYLETWPMFADPDGNAKPEEMPDLLHPNDLGYAKWAAALHPIFATLGFVDQSPDLFVPEPGFTSLFNGRDLTGWCYRPNSPSDIRNAASWRQHDPKAPEWPVITQTVNFDGRTATPDGRYVAKNGRLIVTTPPDYRKIQKLSTQREFPKNFVLKLEFRATPNTDSGIFVREPQLQCRDYTVAGPYLLLKKYKPQDWNEIVVTVTDGKAHCECNGELLEDAMLVPETGPIGLEGDRGQMEYRRIRIHETPDQPRP